MSKNIFSSLWWRIKYFFTGYKAQNFYRSLLTRAPKYVLAVFLLLTICYNLVHPLNRVKIKAAITHNYTITVSIRPVSPITNTFVVSDKEVFIDGNWMQVGKTDYLFYNNVKYYEFRDGVTYRYYKDMYDKWQKEIYEFNSIKDIDDILDADLLDRRNYKRAKGKLFVWELKGGVEREIAGRSATNIQVRRFEGDVAIVGETYVSGQKCEIAVRFSHFGFTKLKFPWDGLPS